MSRTLWESTQTARREHLCDWCHNYIYPGDIYTREVWASGKFLAVMRRHDEPWCPPDPYEDEIDQEIEEEVELGIPIAMTGEVREVVMIGLNGEPIIVPQTHFVPQIICVETQEDFEPEDDPPF